MSQEFAALRARAASLDEVERLSAVKELYESRDIRAIPVLKGLASKDPSVKVRYVAKKAIYLLRKLMEDELAGGDEPLVPNGDLAAPLAGADVAATAPPVPSPQSSPVGEVLDRAADRTHIAINLPVFQKSYAAADPMKRIKYVQAAVRYNAREVLPFLCRQADSEKDETVRATLAISVGILGGADEVRVVASFLKDEDPRVRANAIEGLEYIGHPSVYPIITRFLVDPDNRIRGNVVKALKGYGKVNLSKMLDGMLTSDKPWMRDSAAYCLSIMTSATFLPLLEKGMLDPDREVRRKIRTAVERLVAAGNQDAARLLDGFSDQTSVYHVDGFDFSSLDESSAGLTREDPLFDDDVGVRKAEIERVVAEDDRDMVPALLRRLEVEVEPFIKAYLVVALGRLGDQSAVKPLVGCLVDEVARVRANAIEALATLDPSALDPYVGRLLADENNRVRANAVVALRGSHPVEALEALGAMVSHADELFRRSAFWAVSDIADESVSHFVSCFLDDDSEEIRTRTVHLLHQLREAKPELVDRLVDDLSPRVRELIMGPMTTEQATTAFKAELPEATPPAAADGKRYKYDSFKDLSKDRKLDAIDEVKSGINVHNFYFLREVLQKEKDFVVKVAARRALKSFETQDFAQDRILEETEEPDFLKTPEVQSASYGGFKQVLQLSQDLVVRGKKRENSGAWWGPFPEQFQILNALREDTQDMLAEIVADEDVLRVSLCFYEPRLKPFLEGERSLDMNRYANIVTLAKTANRLDLFSPSRPFLQAIRAPVYLLAVLTAQRVVLFLRGPIEDRQARWRQVWYRQIVKLECERERDLKSIRLTVGTDVVEIPELRPDEADRLLEILKRESIDKIKAEERFIDIDFADELKKLDLLHQGGVLGEAEYRHRRERLLKMDQEKFSEGNVQRILTRRYKDEKLAQRVDEQLMNRFRDELTIVFTDIVGYSRKTSQKQILDLLTILAIHDSLLLPKIKLFNGSLIKKIGDALMVSFKDPINAIECGQAMQAALAEFNRKNADEILVRIGVNTGDVFVKDGDIFGDAVNTAQAMESFCEPGRILLTERTHELVSARYHCEARGRRNLKDGREISVYAVA